MLVLRARIGIASTRPASLAFMQPLHKTYVASVFPSVAQVPPTSTKSGADVKLHVKLEQ